MGGSTALGTCTLSTALSICELRLIGFSNYTIVTLDLNLHPVFIRLQKYINMLQKFDTRHLLGCNTRSGRTQLECRGDARSHHKT